MFTIGMGESDIARINDPFLQTYELGKSGGGKTTLEWNISFTASLLGWGIVVLDGGGDLAENLLGSLPKNRWDDVRVINDEVSFTYNPLDLPYPHHVIIQNMVSALNKMTAVSGYEQPMTALMNKIFYEVVNQALEDGANDLVEIEGRLLAYRGTREQKDSAMRIVDRLALLTRNPRMLQILTGKNELNFKEVAEKQQIILIDSRTMTTREFAFIGNLISQEVSYYIRSQKVKEYKPLLFVVDEFQTTLSSDFSDLFAQARKCQVAVVLAHQNMNQGDKRLFESILGTAGNIICFRLGATDASRMAKEFTDKTTADLRDMEKYHCLCRIEDEDFYVETLPPPYFNENAKNEIIRRLTGKPKEVIQPKTNYMRVGTFRSK